MSHIKWKLWSWGFQWCKNNAKFRPYMVPIWRKKRKVCIQEFLILPTFLMDKSKDIGQFQASFSTFLVGNTSRLYDFSHFESFWDVSMIFKKKVSFLRPPAGPVCMELCKRKKKIPPKCNIDKQEIIATFAGEDCDSKPMWSEEIWYSVNNAGRSPHRDG